MLDTPPPDANVYLGQVGFYHVKPVMSKEPPIWVRVKVIDAKPAFSRVDFIIEPVGGYGSCKASTRRVWFADENLNRCERKPTIL